MFVGKNIEHIGVYKKKDERTVYNVIYRDGKEGTYYMKRFAVTGVRRDQEYDLTQGTPGSKICYFTANSNGEAEVVRVTLKPKARLNKLQFDVDFSELMVKGKQSRGNIVTRNEVHRFSLRERGASTLGGRKVWFDADVNRLNYDGRGEFLGEFQGTDLVLVILKSGEYYTTSFDATNHYDEPILRIERFRPNVVWTAVLNDADQGYPYIKRFKFEPTAKKQRFVGESAASELLLLTDATGARLRVEFGGADDFREPLEIVAAEFIGLKSYKAKGKRLTTYTLGSLSELEPVEVEETAADEAETVEPDDDAAPGAEPDLSDDEVRDNLLGQERLDF